MAFLPPISATTCLICLWPGRTSAVTQRILVPISLEPVKETKRIFGWGTRPSPTTDPAPGRNFATPGGTPASSRSATMGGLSPA